MRFKIDGRARTGRLVYWPIEREGQVKAPSGVKTPGRKARVALPSGKFLSVDPEVVELVEEAK